MRSFREDNCISWSEAEAKIASGEKKEEEVSLGETISQRIDFVSKWKPEAGSRKPESILLPDLRGGYQDLGREIDTGNVAMIPKSWLAEAESRKPEAGRPETGSWLVLWN